MGFAGVLIVLAPKLEHGIVANWATLILVAAAPVSAGSYLLAKRLMQYDRPETIVLWQSFLVAAFTLPVALFVKGSRPSPGFPCACRAPPNNATLPMIDITVERFI